MLSFYIFDLEVTPWETDHCNHAVSFLIDWTVHYMPLKIYGLWNHILELWAVLKGRE